MVAGNSRLWLTNPACAHDSDQSEPGYGTSASCDFSMKSRPARQTRAFAAYNRNGTTKTFFKPESRDYFERQPGELVKPPRRK